MKRKRAIFDKQVIVYLVILAAVITSVFYASRKVLFRPWTTRTHIAAVSDNELVYIIGGLDKNNLPQESVLGINLKERTIKRIASLPVPRYGTAGVRYNGSIYIVGGSDTKQYLDDVLRYDPKSVEVVHIGTLPEPRCFGELVVFDDALYYLGGWNGEKVSSSCIRINPTTGESSIAFNSLPPRQYHTAVHIEGKTYIYGGETSSKEYSANMYSIDLTTGEVVLEGELPQSLARSPATVAENILYIGGGWDGKSVRNLYAINMRDEGLHVQSTVPLPVEPQDRALAFYNDALYLIGGTEEQFGRQIKIVKIDPKTSQTEHCIFKSFVWW